MICNRRCDDCLVTRQCSFKITRKVSPCLEQLTSLSLLDTVLQTQLQTEKYENVSKQGLGRRFLTKITSSHVYITLVHKYTFLSAMIFVKLIFEYQVLKISGHYPNCLKLFSHMKLSALCRNEAALTDWKQDVVFVLFISLQCSEVLLLINGVAYFYSIQVLIIKSTTTVWTLNIIKWWNHPRQGLPWAL